MTPLLGAVSVQQAECKDTTFIWKCLCCTGSSGWGEGGWDGCYLQGSRCSPKLLRAGQTWGPIKSPPLLSSHSAKRPPERCGCFVRHWRNCCLATASFCSRSRGIPLSLSLPRNCPGTLGTACSLLAGQEHLLFPRLPWKTPHQRGAKRHPGDSDPAWSKPTGERQWSGVGHTGGSPLSPRLHRLGTLCCRGSVPLTRHQIELSNKHPVCAGSEPRACVPKPNPRQ